LSYNNLSGVEHARNQEIVHRVNTDRGWYEPQKFPEFLGFWALWMTEIVEVSDAYEEDGLLGGWQAKPQMASELADAYIRLLDDCSRYAVDLGLIVDVYKHTYQHGKAHSFDGVCMQLMRRARNVIEAFRTHGLDETGVIRHSDITKAVAHLYLQLQDTADEFGVDLMKVFDIKMAVNAARPYRHGNKFA
jgi:hypothetical protein